MVYFLCGILKFDYPLYSIQNLFLFRSCSCNLRLATRASQAETRFAILYGKEVIKMRRTGIVIGVAVATVLAVGGLAISAQQARLTGSIAVKGNDEAGYAGMAKVSLDEAIQAALQAVKGKVLKVELEDEDGYLVYGVEIAKADRQIADVKIDAGNGKLLKIDHDRNDGDDREDAEDSENGEKEGGKR
jgi:uncharacterized membrane protein YkoI